MKTTQPKPKEDRIDRLDREMFLAELELLQLRCQRELNKSVNKPFILRRKFVLHNGFCKLMFNKMSELTRGDIEEIVRLLRMKLPDIQPRRAIIPSDLMPNMTPNLEFYLDYSHIKETIKKIEIDIIYRQE